MEENLKRNFNLFSLQHGALNLAAISLADRFHFFRLGNHLNEGYFFQLTFSDNGKADGCFSGCSTTRINIYSGCWRFQWLERLQETSKE